MDFSVTTLFGKQVADFHHYFGKYWSFVETLWTLDSGNFRILCNVHIGHLLAHKIAIHALPHSQSCMFPSVTLEKCLMSIELEYREGLISLKDAESSVEYGRFLVGKVLAPKYA